MPFRVPPSMRLVPVPALLFLALSSAGEAHAATGPADTGIDIDCLSLQYREGAAAYRECLAGADGADTGGREDSSGTLSFDDRHALERACEGRADDCIATELAALERTPLPRLDALDAGERRAVRRQCDAAPVEDGTSGYRRCLSDALDALAALPEPDLEALTLSGRSALELDCAAERDTAAGYRRCVLASLDGEAPPVDGTNAPVASPEDGDLAAGDASPDADAADTSTETTAGLPADEPLALAPPAVEPLEEPATEEPTVPSGEVPDLRAAEPLDEPPPDRSTAVDGPDTDASDTRPAPDDTASGDPAADTTTALDAAADEAPPPDLRQRVDDARARLLTTIDGLDGTERTVLVAALALPLLLLAFRALARGARSGRPAAPAFDGPVRNAALVERVAPSMRTGGGWADEHDRDADDDDFLSDVDADDTAPDDLARERPAFVAFDDGDLFDEDENDEHADRAADDATDDAGPPDLVPRSAFGRRLLAGDTPLERRHAIEFLIYWMAYGDERYEPEARAALLAADDDGEPQTLIKRHVLEEDVTAFADVVRWLQRHGETAERVQVIDLLMALLISEGAMTPAQNTLLHFLADALGLGAEGLDQRHEEAFGRPMPPLARVDLGAWWERVEPDRALRWDAHAVAALDAHERERVRLGLPLGGEIDEAAVVEAFRRAAGRCRPGRFDALGERERALVERQLAKYEEARDRLLGVEADGAGA